MKIIVKKFGGTSVGSIKRIREAANIIKQDCSLDVRVAVVVSAMGKATDELVSLANQITANPIKREMDVLMSSGEQVSSSLLSITLNDMGIDACSFLAHQIKVSTDSNYTKARILNIDSKNIMDAFKEKKVVIIAGFQGINSKGDITTLGRGGSDTSAVAIAACLKADLCEIYTDVDGVYTADPRYVKKAKKHKSITFEEMLEMSSLGAGVLHSRSVELAMNNNIKLHVRSAFNNTEGTLIMNEEDILEKLVVSGITIKKNQSRFSIAKVPDLPGVAACLFEELAKKNIIVDVIVQSSAQSNFNDMSFTIPSEDYEDSKEAIDNFLKTYKDCDGVDYRDDVAILSVVGIGMKSHTGVAAKMFRILSDNNINIGMITTSEIKISCIIGVEYSELAMNKLHDAFGLSM